MLSSRSAYLGITSCCLDIRASPYTYRVLRNPACKQSVFVIHYSLLLSSRSAYLGITSCCLDIRASPYTYRVLRNPACKQSVFVIHDPCTAHAYAYYI